MYRTICSHLLYTGAKSCVVHLCIAENVTDIINFDPRVNVDGVTVSQYESGIQIECQLTYLTYNVSENMRLRFDEDAGLLN